MTVQYIIDPYIVSVLFRESDPDKVLEIYRDLLEKEGQVFDLTIRSFLTAHAVEQADIEKIMTTENPDELDASLKELLKSPELENRIGTNVEQLLKAYFDVLMPELDEATRKDLEAYMQEHRDLLKEQQSTLLKGISALQEILESAGVQSYEELEKLEGESSPEAGAVPEAPVASQSGNGEPAVDAKSKYDSIVSAYLETVKNSPPPVPAATEDTTAVKSQFDKTVSDYIESLKTPSNG